MMFEFNKKSSQGWILFRSLTFTFCIFISNLIWTQQSKDFLIDTVHYFEIPIGSFPPSHTIGNQSIIVDSIKNKVLLPVIGEKDLNQFNLIQFDLNSNNFVVTPLQVPLGNSLDTRCLITCSQLYGDVLGILSCGTLYEFNISNFEFIRVVDFGKQWKYFFKMDTGYLFSYYNHNFDLVQYPLSLELMKTDEEFNVERVIAPDPNFAEFTHFTPSNLVASTGKLIVRSSVSRPIIYLYDSRLNLIDSVDYSSDWVDIEVLLKERKWMKIFRSEDLFSFGTKALEEKASKALSICWVSDKRGYVSYLNTTQNEGVQFFSIENNELILEESFNFEPLAYEKEKREHANELFDKNSFQIYLQRSKAKAYAERLYIFKESVPFLPWMHTFNEMNKIESEFNSSQTISIGLFIFNLTL